MKKFLVVPSIRETGIREFLRAWQVAGDWDEVVVIEDNPHKTFDLPAGVHHFAWDDINRHLGAGTWIISRRDSAIRSFGFLVAYQMGADFILTLDDDCFPSDHSPICEAHHSAMQSIPRWVPSVPGMRTRGLPYRNLGSLQGVVANMGLWSGIADLDSVQTLAGWTNEDYEPPAGSRIIPAGQYFPLCGMNFAFLRDIAPLCYFPLMGDGQPYRRFDDIWCGVIFKRILDHLGLYVSVGDPAIEHRRASDAMANLVKEAPGIARNETFWETVDRAPLTASTPTDCMSEMGTHLESDADPYVSRLGVAIQTWANLFR